MDNIARKMEEAGLAYEITGVPSPLFLLTGGKSVVAMWKNGVVERQFAGFYPDNTGEVPAQSARRIRGCYAVYIVDAENVGQ